MVLLGMDEQRGGRVNGIRQIVKLKEIIHKWHHPTIGHKADHGSSSNPSPTRDISPEISKRLSGCNVYVDLDDESSQSLDPPQGVPKGSLAVYVGPELRRFIIPTSYLSDPLFKRLLEKVEEEFGFDHSGGLTIPCETETFKYLLNCMENHQKELGVHDNGESSHSLEILLLFYL